MLPEIYLIMLMIDGQYEEHHTITYKNFQSVYPSYQIPICSNLFRIIKYVVEKVDINIKN